MAKQIDKKVLTDLILSLDSERKYDNLTALYKDVANEYSSAHAIQFSPAFVGLKVAEYGLVLKTQKGAKGRAKGSGPVVRKPKGERLKGNKSIAALRKEMEGDVDARPFLSVLDKFQGGSLKAGVKLNCLYCGNWQKLEVKFCRCVTCPWHSVRPYQTSKDSNASNS